MDGALLTCVLPSHAAYVCALCTCATLMTSVTSMYARSSSLSATASDVRPAKQGHPLARSYDGASVAHLPESLQHAEPRRIKPLLWHCVVLLLLAALMHAAASACALHRLHEGSVASCTHCSMYTSQSCSTMCNAIPADRARIDNI
jgi:hypothetical protein